jgi:hypothetical protein
MRHGGRSSAGRGGWFLRRAVRRFLIGYRHDEECRCLEREGSVSMRYLRAERV